MSEEIFTCKSCSNKFSGSYCNMCGEKVIDPNDRKLRVFVGEFINALTFADNKLWRTIRTITFSPGRLTLDFTEGRRVRYMKIISVFFLANLMYFLLPSFNTFNTSLNTHVSSVTFLHREIAENMVMDRLEREGVSMEEFTETFNARTTELSKLLMILMALMLGFFLQLIHAGRKHLTADHFHLALEYMSFILLYPIILQSFLIRLLGRIGVEIPDREWLITSVAMILILFFAFKSERTFFKNRGLRLVVNSILALVALSASVFLYRALLFFITFWLI